MVERCDACGSEFLTEADPYVVRPTPNGIKLYCVCQIKGLNEVKTLEPLAVKDSFKLFLADEKSKGAQ